MEDNKSLHLLIGELVSNVRTSADAINRQSESIIQLSNSFQDQSRKLDRVEHSLDLAHQEIRTLKDTIVTTETLRLIGINVDDKEAQREDFLYLRESRERQRSRHNGLSKIALALIIAGLTSFGYWSGNAIYNQIHSDISRRMVQHDKIDKSTYISGAQ